ncbi:MAG: hypothetical protein QXR02_02565 [Acidilobaceae archaeon]
MLPYKEACRTCVFWRPSISYNSIGLCIKREVIRLITDWGGDCYSRLNLSKFSMMWCATCNRVVHEAEYEDHIFHELYPPPYVDLSIVEEIYGG